MRAASYHPTSKVLILSELRRCRRPYSIMLSMLSASAGFNGPALAGSRSSIRVSMDTNIVECPGPVSKVQAVANPGSSPEFAELKSLSKQLNPVVGYYDPLSAPPPLLPPVPRAAAASLPWIGLTPARRSSG